MTSEIETFVFDVRTLDYMAAKCQRLACAIVDEAGRDAVPLQPTFVAALSRPSGVSYLVTGEACIGGGGAASLCRRHYAESVAERGLILLAISAAYEIGPVMSEATGIQCTTVRLDGLLTRVERSHKGNQWEKGLDGTSGYWMREYVEFFLARRRMEAERVAELAG